MATPCKTLDLGGSAFYNSKITPTILMERKKKSQLLQPPPPPSSPTTKITFSPQIIPSMGEQTQTKPHYTPTPPPQPSTLPSQSSKPPHQLRPWNIQLKFPTNPYYHQQYRNKNPKTKIQQIENHLTPRNPIHTSNHNNVCLL